MATVTFRLLGALVIEADGKRIPAPGSAKSQALLARLLLSHTPVTRAVLVHDLWPDTDDETRGRKKLSQEVWRLRTTLDELGLGERLDQRDDTLSMVRDAGGRIPGVHVDVDDVNDYVSAARTARPGSSEELRLLAAAADLLVGELMAGHDDVWLSPRQLDMNDTARRVLDRLAEVYTARGAYDEARPVTRRLLDIDPLAEAAHRRLMRIELLAGRPAAAMKAWEACRDILSLELGVEPDAETRMLRTEIDGLRTADISAPNGSDAEPAPLPKTTVGRSDERAELVSFIDGLVLGRGGVALIEGDAGFGKSHLIDDFVRDAAWRGVRVSTATPRPTARAPFSTIARVLSNLIGPLDASRLRNRLPTPQLAALTGLVPDLADDLAADATAAASVDGAVRTAFVRAINVLSESDPIALTIDSFENTDDESADVLFALMRHVDQYRVGVVLTYRPEDLRGRDGLWKQLQDIDAGSRCRHLRLTPFGGDELMELIAALLPASSDDELPQSLADATGGHPYLAVETLGFMRELGRDRLPARAAGGLGAQVRSNVENRLETLDPTTRGVLEHLVVAGDAVELDALAAMAGIGVDDTIDSVHTLERHRLGRADSVTVSTAHQFLSNAVYETIAPSDRVRIHARVAETLIDRGDEALQIARHLDAAGQHEAAFGWWLTAAESARQQGAIDAALDAARHALATETGALDPRLTQLAFELQHACSVRRDHERGEELLDIITQRLDGMADADPDEITSLRAELAHRRVAHLAHVRQHAEAAKVAQHALEAFREPDHRAAVLGALARAEMLSGDVGAAADTIRQAWDENPTDAATRMSLLDAEAAQLLSSDMANPRIFHLAEQGRAIAEATERPESALRFATMAGASLLADNPADGEQRLAELIETADDRGMYASVVHVANSRFESLGAVGLKGRAVAGFRDLIERSHREDLPDLQVAETRRNLTTQLAELTGDEDAVEHLIAEALPLLSHLGAPDIAAGSEAGVRAVLAMGRGALDEAETLLDAYVHALDQNGVRHRRPEPILWRAQLLTLQGDPESALQHLDHLPRATIGDRRRAGAMRADLLVQTDQLDLAAQLIDGLLLRPAFGVQPQLELARFRLAQRQERDDDAEVALDRAWEAVAAAFEPYDPVDAPMPGFEYNEIIALHNGRRRPALTLVSSDGAPVTVELPARPSVDERRIAVAEVLRRAASLGAAVSPQKLADALDISLSTARRDIAVVRERGA